MSPDVTTKIVLSATVIGLALAEPTPFGEVGALWFLAFLWTGEDPGAPAT